MAEVHIFIGAWKKGSPYFSIISLLSSLSRYVVFNSSVSTCSCRGLYIEDGGGAGQPFLDSTTLFHEGDSLPIDSIGYTAKNEMEQIGTWTGQQVLI